MTPVSLTHATFESTVSRPGIVVVDFWAPWCGPCRAFAPTFASAAAKHADVTFAKINTDEEPQLAGEWGIRSIPTVMAFKDGIAVFAQPGVLPPQGLDELVRQLRALDMAEVRQKLAAQGGQP